MPKRKEGVYGPYKYGTRFRVIHVGRDGSQSASSFADEREAKAIVQKARRALAAERSPSIETVLVRYREGMKQRGYDRCCNPQMDLTESRRARGIERPSRSPHGRRRNQHRSTQGHAHKQ